MAQKAELSALFSAFSRINERVFRKDTLLSCPTLSKAPNYGNVLRLFVNKTPSQPLPKKQWAKIIFRYYLKNIAHLLFLLLVRLYIALLRWPLPAALSPERIQHGQKPLVVLDTFAVLPRLATDGFYKELYMPHLLETANTQGMEPVQLFRMYGSRNPRVTWKALKVLALQQNALTEVHLFTWTDWFTLVRHLVVYPFALYKLIRSLTHYPQGSPEQAIRTALMLSAGQCIMLGEARRIAGYRLGMLLAGWHADKAVEAPKVISWYENQTVNKTFQRGMQQARKKTGKVIPVIGTQLFIWPDNLLNNTPDDAEAALGLAPDTVVVSGTAFLPANSTQRYVTGASLRYGYLFAPLSSQEQKQEKHILVLLSYHPEETVRVLETVLPLAQAGQPIVYKFHPATQPQDFAPWLPQSPVTVEGSLQDAMASAKVVVGSGSGALAEAVCVGVPAITIDGQSDQQSALALNYLPAFGQGTLWQKISLAHQLPQAVDALCAFKETAEYEATRTTFRSMLFTEPSSDNLIALLALR